MPLRTVEQYVESLRDGRIVCYRGQRVPDVTRHPVISVAVDHASIDYRLADDPASRDLAVVKDSDGGEYSRYWRGVLVLVRVLVLGAGTERIPLRCFVDLNAPNRKSDLGI